MAEEDKDVGNLLLLQEERFPGLRNRELPPTLKRTGVRLVMTELIFALDVQNRVESGRWVELLGDEVNWYKVGLELFIKEGPRVVDEITSRNKKVFLDLKIHDIPRTVAKATAQAATTGAEMLTVHASGGRAMMEAAAAEVAKLANPPKIVAVTVLTSLDTDALRDMGLRRNSSGWAAQLARLAKESGLDGVVASVGEVETIKADCGGGFLVVTPGIRPSGSGMDDQKRTATPELAAGKGADYIVVGRPIRKANDPAAVARQIKRSLSGDLAG